ncbi:hypothetical protein D3C76_1053020 [compost metagenome]
MTDLDPGQLGFLEVGGDVEGLLVYQCHHRLPGLHIVALGQTQVGDLTVARRAQLAAAQIELGQLHLGQRLLVFAIGDPRPDLRTFLVFGADCRGIQAAAPRGFALAQAELLLAGVGQGLGLFQVGLVALAVDAHQQVAGLDLLVVLHAQVGNPPGYVRSDHHHIGAHPGVAGPRREHVVMPQPEAGQHRSGDHDQGEGYAKESAHAELSFLKRLQRGSR